MATPAEVEGYKQAAAERAVADFVRSGMVVGLGTGSTAIFATRRIGTLLADGTLTDIVGVPTAIATGDEARRVGVPLLTDEVPWEIDVTIDGADEVDPALDVIKGGGGALLREKLVAQASAREVIVVDEAKRSPRLGTHVALPVEVVAFGLATTRQAIERLGAQVEVRRSPDGEIVNTDQGNLVLDCDFGPIEDAEALATALTAHAGVVEHGLFLGITSALVVSGAAGVEVIRRP
jgi:ribose 5-phosphate isomerase A